MSHFCQIYEFACPGCYKDPGQAVQPSHQPTAENPLKKMESRTKNPLILLFCFLKIYFMYLNETTLLCSSYILS